MVQGTGHTVVCTINFNSYIVSVLRLTAIYAHVATGAQHTYPYVKPFL